MTLGTSAVLGLLALAVAVYCLHSGKKWKFSTVFAWITGILFLLAAGYLVLGLLLTASL